MKQSEFVIKELLYENPLSSPEDIDGFRLEGAAVLTFPHGRLRMENAFDASLGQKSNFVFWCSETFPDDVAISWDFWPVREPGLCITFFAARGHDGHDLFDSSLAKRTGEYWQYHHGDIDAYHVSYFRRRSFPAEEKGMHITNLRKSYGFHLIAQGADPLPAVVNAWPPYRLELIICQGEIEFAIDGITSIRCIDNETVGGAPLRGGKIGFRQMAPLVADYANLQVHRVEPRYATDDRTREGRT